ncbi:MAG: Ig-like domain-containing protein [Fimbriimonadaceae bacterium]
MNHRKCHRRIPLGYIAAFVAAATVIGCGTVDPSMILTTTTDGTTRPAVFYGTNWNGGTFGPLGQLQRVRLIRPNGEVIRSATIKRSEGNRADFLEVPAGQYLLEVRLFLDEEGEVQSGQLRQSIRVDGPVSLDSSVGATPDSFLVTPPEVEVVRGASFRLGAALVSQSRLTFAFPDSITWTSSSNAVGVSQEGLVVGVEEGEATVTAEHRSGVVGSSQITVR